MPNLKQIRREEEGKRHRHLLPVVTRRTEQAPEQERIARKKASQRIRELALAPTLEEALEFTEGFVQWEGE